MTNHPREKSDAGDKADDRPHDKGAPSINGFHPGDFFVNHWLGVLLLVVWGSLMSPLVTFPGGNPRQLWWVCVGVCLFVNYLIYCCFNWQISRMLRSDTSAQPTTQSVQIDREQFKIALRNCDESIGKYSALRSHLFNLLLDLKQQTDGPWKIQYKRDAALGDPTLPVRWTHAVSTDFKVEGLELIAGVAQIKQPETYAPFVEFELIGPEDSRPRKGSESERIQMRLSILLEQMLENMKVLVRSLAVIERLAPQLFAGINLAPISRLALTIPVFPYWPQVKGMTRADFDKVTADEKPLLDEVRLTLRRMS
ncbi:MAG TPA: hypothetical protein VH370_20525 [Humisphaera sp.]|jgi:hypothetical protein|nr:hypothetical protein [Humisphaera sp.]